MSIKDKKRPEISPRPGTSFKKTWVQKAYQDILEELDTFTHSLTHDLRNPLSAIMSTAQVLDMICAELSPDELRTHLGSIIQQVQRMSNILKELLLLSEIRKTKMIQKAPLDMEAIVEKALEQVKTLPKAGETEIILPKHWPTVMGCEPWIVEVWVNYIGNAIKYGGDPPHIVLGSTEYEPNPKMVQFWISDNGQGFDLETKSHLFTPFTRLEQVSTKGHGLGLSIVKRIIDKHKGRVRAESKVGYGSIFTFTLPKAPEETL